METSSVQNFFDLMQWADQRWPGFYRSMTAVIDLTEAEAQQTDRAMERDPEGSDILFLLFERVTQQRELTQKEKQLIARCTYAKVFDTEGALIYLLPKSYLPTEGE